MMIKMQEIMRKFLVDVAKAADAEMTEEMAAFIKKLTVDGLYAEATFGCLFLCLNYLT